jgi:SSS family solute:Na+ symporter
LVIPFIVCVPGIIAFALYSDKMAENAMKDRTLNAPGLEKFSQLKDTPSQADRLFPFNADFAALHPELAEEIYAFNLAVAGSDATTEGSLAERNSTLIKTATAQQSKLSESQMLIGYDYDGAFPLLIRYLTPVGLRGFVTAALMGAVISSLASMLNAASTIFTMDLFREYIRPGASQKTLILIGRIVVLISVLVGCMIAPQLANPKFSGAFAYIQEFQGFVSPGILTIFLFGLLIPIAPRISGLVGLILSPVIYGTLFFAYGDMAFLNRMAITVGLIALVLTVLSIVRPLREPISLPKQSKIEIQGSKGAAIYGIIVCILTAVLYVVFW